MSDREVWPLVSGHDRTLDKVVRTDLGEGAGADIGT